MLASELSEIAKKTLINLQPIEENDPFYIYIFRAGSTEEMTETKVNVYLIQANYEITLGPLE